METGEAAETETNWYSDDFVPVQAAEYSVDNNMAILRRLESGMSIEEAEEIINSVGMHTFRIDGSMSCVTEMVISESAGP